MNTIIPLREKMSFAGALGGRSDQQKIHLKDSLRAIFGNGPLLLVILSLFLTVIPSLQMVTMAIGAGLVPWLTKYINGKKLVIYSGFILALLGTVMYFIGYDNILLFYIFAALWGLFNGFPDVIRTTMIANTVEWMEKQTGKRSDGTIFLPSPLSASSLPEWVNS